jgi:hypothetical protein
MIVSPAEIKKRGKRPDMTPAPFDCAKLIRFRRQLIDKG